MEGHRVGMTTDLSDSSNHHNMPPPYATMLHGLPTTSHGNNFIYQQGSAAFDFGELEEAIVLQGVKLGNDEYNKKSTFFTTRPAATLEMFPSLPIRFQPTPRGSSTTGGEEESTDSGSALNPQLEPESPISKKASNQPFDHKLQQQQQQLVEMAIDASRGAAEPLQQDQLPKIQEKRKGGGSTSDRPLDAKTLRRLAQNREAAKKSRLRKKAYVQQLESSRIKLTQLEQDLQRARSQGLFLAGGGAGGSVSSDAAMFDMEYARWLEDEQRHMSELRTALQAHLSDGDLRLILDGHLAHYDEIFGLKGIAAKSDVFHLIAGMWITPAERCFLWMGGFRPSEILKILMPQLDPLTEQQLMGICSLQQSSQQAEEALSQGLEQLYQSLADTVASGSLSDGAHVGDYMGQMALALSKLSNLEGFVRQADNLRQQTLHQMHRILTAKQAARSFLAIGEYNNRLRALSSLWASRPRENLISDDNSCQTTTDLQMVQHPNNHYSSY